MKERFPTGSRHRAVSRKRFRGFMLGVGPKKSTALTGHLRVTTFFFKAHGSCVVFHIDRVSVPEPPLTRPIGATTWIDLAQVSDWEGD